MADGAILDGIVLSEGGVVTARFVGAARRYWIGVFPTVCKELARWRVRAAAIPDPGLRRLALEAQAKRSNMEGAAVFAAYAPRSGRAAAVRAAVAFQSAYNYLDLLSEQPCADPIANGRSLHAALIAALQPEAAGREDQRYYAHARRGEDGGYLQAMVDRCREALRALPSWEAVAGPAGLAAERVLEFQSLNLGEANGDHRTLAEWAQRAAPPGCEMRWWEIAAAAGSSLGVHVMIAAASDPHLGAGQVRSLERAYFPWIGALHSMLDTAVDLAEDARTGQRSLLSYYSSAEEAASRMRWLVERSRAAVSELPDSERHVMFLAAMTGMYMSMPQSTDPAIRRVRMETLDAVGALAKPTLLVFAVRRFLSAVRTEARRRGREGRRPAEAQRGAESAMSCAAEVQQPWGAITALDPDLPVSAPLSSQSASGRSADGAGTAEQEPAHGRTPARGNHRPAPEHLLAAEGATAG